MLYIVTYFDLHTLWSCFTKQSKLAGYVKMEKWEEKCVTGNAKLWISDEYWFWFSPIWTPCSGPLHCLADIHFEIWDRQCWSLLIFRQGSGLFCRTGLRSCNFWKWVQPPMLTGNVCCSECIHMASTNKQYNTISTLWLHRKTRGRKKEGEWGRERAVKQMELASQHIHFSKLCKERKEILTQRHTLTNKYVCYEF